MSAVFAREPRMRTGIGESHAFPRFDLEEMTNEVLGCKQGSSSNVCDGGREITHLLCLRYIDARHANRPDGWTLET